MTKLALYELAEQYLEAADKLADLDLPEQTVTDTLEGLRYPVEQKATNIAMMVKDWEAKADAIRGAAKAMLSRADAVEKRAAQVKAYLQAQMERTGIQRIDSPYFRIALRDNPPHVRTDPFFERDVPEKYWVQPETPPKRLDKVAIAKALKAGDTVQGCTLETTRRVEIK